MAPQDGEDPKGASVLVLDLESGGGVASRPKTDGPQQSEDEEWFTGSELALRSHVELGSGPQTEVGGLELEPSVAELRELATPRVDLPSFWAQLAWSAVAQKLLAGLGPARVLHVYADSASLAADCIGTMGDAFVAANPRGVQAQDNAEPRTPLLVVSPRGASDEALAAAARMERLPRATLAAGLDDDEKGAFAQRWRERSSWVRHLAEPSSPEPFEPAIAAAEALRQWTGRLAVDHERVCPVVSFLWTGEAFAHSEPEPVASLKSLRRVAQDYGAVVLWMQEGGAAVDARDLSIGLRIFGEVDPEDWDSDRGVAIEAEIRDPRMGRWGRVRGRWWPAVGALEF